MDPLQTEGCGPLRFDGRVALVTGAANGLGRAHAELLAERGASVVVNDIADPGPAVAGIAARGGTALGVGADCATSRGAAQAVQAAVDTYGRLDIVINNAGILRAAPIAATDDNLWDMVLAANLRSAFAVTRAAWPIMESSGYGRVIMTVSNSGMLGQRGSAAYAASKAGLVGLVRVLALEGEDAGIRTNAVAPIAYTSMSRQSKAAPARWRSGEGDRWADALRPDLVSPVVAWLCHEHCALNGEIISAAGGRVARFFLGVTEGVVDRDLTVEAVAGSESAMLGTDRYQIFSSGAEEARSVHDLIFPERGNDRGGVTGLI
ncbi:SDR family NAD(P)-dependent oxidoreductase [Acidiferrimicrobium sp. IK]|uniref:SDR family NAD(P)-dependent oxidoreductase n=1 Tax=Acidiferrimicrobium sp. IK TaxID=2871700 RepID=UPI0021CB92C7|nr:SDR family NAD(P)-dependent oxidoreductase [Acidiferrimicrobium sp. IK]MCU4184059.1 SDR family NAD(P)-dependent oxidoreductase [Acidiferrimicrobium sp. IK]